jgi:hypothetical protein
MSYISIRDLQKMSGEKIQRLPGTTPIKSGDRTVALLIPLKPPNMKRLRATLAKAEALAKGRDPKKDDAALAKFGDVDPTNWSIEAVRKLQFEHRRSLKTRRKPK